VHAQTGVTEPAIELLDIALRIDEESQTSKSPQLVKCNGDGIEASLEKVMETRRNLGAYALFLSCSKLSRVCFFSCCLIVLFNMRNLIE
jgi:hypothetical protein